MKNKTILLIGLIPFVAVILGFAWRLILQGFTEPSDITFIISAIATGGLFVALSFTIKYIFKKSK